jgi:hypothetical protein
MAQVNSENSTSMPVVSTRRRFLSQTAGVAAGGAVLALAAIPPAPALAAPAVTLDPANASPALRVATIALGAAHDRLEAAKARFDADDRKVAAWAEGNPKPSGKRAVKRWARRWNEYRDAVEGESWAQQCDAEEHFRGALMAVAMIDSRDMGELALKACLSSVYDGVRLSWSSGAPIGFSVAIDLLALTLRVSS